MSSAVAIPLLVLVIGWVAGCLTAVVRDGPPRYLPKWAWALVICATVPWGGVAYLAFGRTRRPGIPLETLAPFQPHDPGEPPASAPAAAPRARRPSAGPVSIEVNGLTKRFGEVTAVDGLSFAVQPGKVTGFLGPNGAGKTTTMRVILGLASPTNGTALIAGRRYRDIIRPLHE